MTTRSKRRLNRAHRKAQRFLPEHPSPRYLAALSSELEIIAFREGMRDMTEHLVRLGRAMAKLRRASAPKSVLHNGKARRKGQRR